MKGQSIKILTALSMGFCSGFVIYLMGSLLYFAFIGMQGANQFPTLGLILLIGGWIASSYGLLQGAQTTSKVLARGFLLGAVEWLLMIGVGFIRATKVIDVSGAPDSGFEVSLISAGGVATVISGASLFMVLVCLAGYAIVHFWRREMKPEKDTLPLV